MDPTIEFSAFNSGHKRILPTTQPLAWMEPELDKPIVTLLGGPWPVMNGVISVKTILVIVAWVPGTYNCTCSPPWTSKDGTSEYGPRSVRNRSQSLAIGLLPSEP